jgi:serine/threonine-protein kinase RsbW
LKYLLVISSSLININKVRLFLEEIFVESCLNQSYFNRIFLGLSEALTNSIVHGNRQCSTKNVSIEVFLLQNELVIEITDEGEGFSLDSLPDPTCLENIKNENGRGIFLIRHYADDLSFLEGGRRVRMKYKLN